MGTFLNIGLKFENDCIWHQQDVLVVLGFFNIDPEHTEVQDTLGDEPTLVVTLDSEPGEFTVWSMAQMLKQDCIAVWTPFEPGKLLGPRSERWMPFDRRKFLLPKDCKGININELA